VRPDYNMPWRMKDQETTVGSGAVIAGGLILTNAHVVSDATYIQVKKESDPDLYDAEIMFIGHDCDLALLKAKDPNSTGTPWSWSSADTGAQVKGRHVWLPMGGSRISITEGVTSRIEISQYTHCGSVSFLTIQTDAAINPGNSGGPVIQNNRIVGVAFQASAIRIISLHDPVPVIRHFLADVRDGK